jgi:DNA-directed RNA polymerase subunit RPC12/RpoP/RecJ-like exonuclease
MGEVELIAAICPRCGANLSIPDNLVKAHCMYCGTEILVHDLAPSHDHIAECKVCDGYGRVDRCRACDGTGGCTWSSRIPEILINEIPLSYSTATCEEGLCSYCHGAGKGLLLPCKACGGSGKCPRCLGTGKCVGCRGTGFFPNPKGEERCPSCKGTGTLEKGPST